MDEKEYIERNAIEYRYVNTGAWAINNEVCKAYDEGVKAMEDQIKAIPAADVVEVRHERFEWGYQNGQYGIWCTNCGAGWANSENAEWIAHEHDYCPKCGAKMDGKGESDVV